MTSLNAIGFTFGLGSAWASVCLLSFYVAVRVRSQNIAPRCTARPKATIYTTHPKDASQERGNAMLGWIPWVMGLSYETLINGVPGTGTHEGGLEGRFLSVNLDGIMLLRFQTICLKISALACFLSLTIILPMNLTAQCYEPDLGPGKLGSVNGTNGTTSPFQEVCFDPTNGSSVLTDYDRTTIANIPPVISGVNGNLTFSLEALEQAVWFTGGQKGVLGRLYGIVLVSWVVFIYAMLLLRAEWQEALALRRVYYFENDVWPRRKKELGQTTGRVAAAYLRHHRSLLAASRTNAGVDVDELRALVDIPPPPPPEDEDESDLEANESLEYMSASSNVGDTDEQRAYDEEFQKKPAHRRRVQFLKTYDDDDEEHDLRRDPWIPNPDYRDTVSNVELYSVLVGDVPSLPSEFVSKSVQEHGEGVSMEEAIGWQTAVVSAFFSQCIPAQPGFSSSVAAVTIIPDAPHMAAAWRKWYGAAAALRRLKFIRIVIADKRSGGKRNFVAESTRYLEKESLKSGIGSAGDVRGSYSRRVNEHDDSLLSSRSRSLFGSEDNIDVEQQLFDALDYGPEQTALYSRELAQGAANCCPNGCGEGKLRNTDIASLLDLEQEALERVHQAYFELQVAREEAAVAVAPSPKATPKGSPKRVKSQGVNANGAIESPNGMKKSKSWTEPSHSSDSPKEAKHARHKTALDGISTLPDKFKVETMLFAKHNIHGPLRRKKDSKSPASAARRKPGSSPTGLQREGDGNIPGPAGKRTPDRGLATALQSDHANVSVRFKGTNLTLDREGRLVFGEPDRGHPHLDALEEESDHESEFGGSYAIGTDGGASQDPTIQTENVSPVDRPSIALPQSFTSSSAAVDDRWQQVQTIRRQGASRHVLPGAGGGQADSMDTGAWNVPSPKDAANAAREGLSDGWSNGFYRCKKRAGKGMNRVSDEMKGKSTFAVVTFTSRQAAVAARQCIGDGRGQKRWNTVNTIPVPPLADSATFDIITCRGCCRPVTMSINRNEKSMRRFIGFGLLFVVYVFWTFPFTFAAALVDPKNLAKAIPWLNELSPEFYEWFQKFTGLIPGLLQTLFVSLCPMMFRGISNSFSAANSVAEAEGYALQYYWWFMLVTAFTGTSLLSMVLTGFRSGAQSINFTAFLVSVAETIPTTISPVWINWNIIRALISLPSMYMLQLNAFAFDFLGLQCCRRATLGGGPGADVPYRIYVDSGVSFMCVMGLGFASPLVAAFSFFSLLVSVPIIRRNVLYIYRPKFDGGGFRWPFLFNVFISSMVLGQILLFIMILLKQAYGPAIIELLAIPPTLVFRRRMLERYRHPYNDAGLLQTSLVNDWEANNPSPILKREEFRRFLVDAHKAAYVPVCVAGAATQVLTDEPATVVPLAGEEKDVRAKRL